MSTQSQGNNNNISKSHTWFQIQDLPRASFFNWLTQMQVSAWAWKDEFGFVDCVSVYHEETVELHHDEVQWRAAGQAALAKFTRDDGWLEEITNKVRERSLDFFDFCQTIRSIIPADLTNEQLAEIVSRFEEKRFQLHTPGVIITFLEFNNEFFTKYLQNYLSDQIGKTMSDLSVNEAFSKLTIFHEDTFIRKEEKAMLRILAEVQNHPEAVSFFRENAVSFIAETLAQKFPDIAVLLKKHFDEYCWLQYQYIGPAYEITHFINNLQALIIKSINAQGALDAFDKERELVKAHQNQLLFQLKFDKRHERIFSLARDVAFTKSFRNDAYYYGYFCMDKVLREIAGRLNITLSQTRLFVPGEMQNALTKGEYSVEDLSVRAKYAAYVIFSGNGKMFTGEEAKRIVAHIKSLESGPNDTSEFKGTTAVLGKATGRAKLILEVDDLSKMNEGDILISNATYPSLVPGMKKAAAIVTDLGGITSHAAIISRELGIPCIVGTKIATKVIKDGDFIEVDANRGIVKKKF